MSFDTRINPNAHQFSVKQYLRGPVVAAIAVLLLFYAIYTSGLEPVSLWSPEERPATFYDTKNSSAHFSNIINDIALDHTFESDAGRDDQNGETSFLPGLILHTGRREIFSADGSHMLRLGNTGSLTLHRMLSTTGTAHTETQLIWSLGTGSEDANAEHAVTLSSDGVLSITALLTYEEQVNGQNVERFAEQLLWHSNLLSQCQTPTPFSAHQPPALQLKSTGELAIQNRCSIYTPPPSSAGNLAILVSGLYRTNAQTCTSHIKYLAENPSAERVDIFAYVLYEPEDLASTNATALAASIRACYAPYLRTLTLRPVSAVAEPFPGPAQPACSKVDRLHSQLKTLHLGAVEWWTWSMSQGVKHDTVMRIRTDHEFYGPSLPILKPVKDLGGNELVLAPIAAGVPVPMAQRWFCSGPWGDMDIAISDQIAYGRPSAMRFFLSMYQDFPAVVGMTVPQPPPSLSLPEPIPQPVSGNPSWLCLGMPSGSSPEQCAANERELCTIECALSWYLQSWGVEMNVDWDLKFRIMR